MKKEIKFMVVCMFTLLTVTFLSISCKVEDAAVKEWTVTIDPNNMSLSGTLKVTVKDGEKASLPSDIQPPTDYEIPYYSTVKDDYSKVYDFANTAVTSDITVYPHYRLVKEKAYTRFVGNWLDKSETGLGNIRIYKISSDNALNASCYARNGAQDIDFSNPLNSSIVEGILKLVVLPVTTANPFGYSANSVDYSPVTIKCQYFEPLSFKYPSNSSDSLIYTNSNLFLYPLEPSYEPNLDSTGILTFTSEDKTDVRKFVKLN